MKIVSRRLRFILPVSLGLVSAGLMVWDIHNEKIIESMGMRWDMGAPVWPYQTAEILFFALNLPAYLLSNPITHAYQFLGPRHYIVLFPVSVFWWYLVGIYFDCGVGTQRIHARWSWFLFCVLAATGLFIGGAYMMQTPWDWWRLSGDRRRVDSAVIFLRLVAPACWCFVLGIASGIVARRLAKGSIVVKSP